MIEFLDLGIIMGSQSQDIFLDMVKRYPGAQKFYDHVETLPCHPLCDDPYCSRRSMQGYLKDWFDDDKDKIALFFERMTEVDGTPSMQTIQAILAKMGRIVSTGSEREFVEHFEKMLNEKGIKFTRLDLN